MFRQLARVLVMGIFIASAPLSHAQNVFTNPGAADPDAFGHAVIFLGLGQVAGVYFDPTCAAGTVTPPDVCVVVPTDGTPVQFSFDDLGSMVIPAGSTKTEIWPVMIFHAILNFQDQTGVGSRGIFMGNVIITIESNVLKDPSLTDPNTGLPLDGKLVTSFNGVLGENRALGPNEFYASRARTDSSGIAAFTTQSLISGSVGTLTAKQVKKLFSEKITLHFGLSGTAASVPTGAFISGIKLFGDR